MRRAAALFVLPGLALATATGVSLSEFHPSVSGLSKNCESLYTSTLPGCQPSDFEPNSSGTNHCSSSCLATLNTVTQVIHHVCGDENLHGTNLISAFLAGDGTQKICPNAPGNSASSSPSTSAQQNSPSTPASSAAVQTSASSSPSTSSAAPVAASTTSAITTSASTPAGIEIDSTGSPTAPSTAASATSSSATSQQDISHGGSPFDMSNNAAGRHTPHMIPGITAALVVVLLGSLAL